MSTPPLESRLGEILRERKLTLATAESCTGGLVGHRLTNVPGSSDYYLGGVIAYAYSAKVRQLGVKWGTLEAHGAVSPETVIEMAEGVRAAFEADIGVSISGVAGPSGGTPEKPVGLVWFGLSVLGDTWTREKRFTGDRLAIKERAAEAALGFVTDYLEGRL